MAKEETIIAEVIDGDVVAPLNCENEVITESGNVSNSTGSTNDDTNDD